MITLFKSVKDFVNFLFAWRSGGGQLVDQNTANMRAATCSTCHNNLASGEVRKSCCGAGAAANAALWAARKIIIQNKNTPYDKQLLACGLCGCDLKIKVWIPNEVLVVPEDANAWPSFCWVKKIADGTQV